ncbi:MAG: hypothetical protein ABEI52_10330 [Halobacteriaceae archaeon]
MPGPTDDFDAHLEEAERRVSNGFGRRIAEELALPFLHPVFPRPVSDPVDWTHYTHSLDPETLRINNSRLERIDLQLLRMVADAQSRLSEQGIPTRDRFIANGFSASATFANRFSAIHPEKLISVSAGGLDGTLILPIEETEIPVNWIDSAKLNYPVGTANIEELTGDPFSLGAFCDVHQFLYLGEDDMNDTLLYPDAWTEPQIRGIAVSVYGEDIHEERFPYCKTVYEDVGVSAVFRQYEGTGHDPTPAIEDVVEFHERTLAGDDIESIRADLGGNVGEV